MSDMPPTQIDPEAQRYVGQFQQRLALSGHFFRVAGE